MKTVRRLAILFGVLGLLGGLMTAAAQSRDGYDRHVVVVNNSAYTIRELYAANVDVKQWEEDVLHEGVLLPGHRVRVDIDDGTGHCFYDLKAVFQDGSETIHWGMNVCKAETWTLTN